VADRPSGSAQDNYHAHIRADFVGSVRWKRQMCKPSTQGVSTLESTKTVAEINLYMVSKFLPAFQK
jgi:hypothetical protein